jgi:MOSC domain-containing protein YiiM
VLAVSEPRMPCFKFAAAMGFAQAVKLMAQSGYCGSYLAVVQPGTVTAGDGIRLEPGPRDVSIAELFRARARRRCCADTGRRRGTVGPMLAYRHAFHAGNHADVLKHLTLVARCCST